MGVRHRHYPVYGVQFHPESIGTASGRALVAAFLAVRPRAVTVGSPPLVARLGEIHDRRSVPFSVPAGRSRCAARGRGRVRRRRPGGGRRPPRSRRRRIPTSRAPSSRRRSRSPPPRPSLQLASARAEQRERTTPDKSTRYAPAEPPAATGTPAAALRRRRAPFHGPEEDGPAARRGADRHVELREPLPSHRLDAPRRDRPLPHDGPGGHALRRREAHARREPGAYRALLLLTPAT